MNPKHMYKSCVMYSVIKCEHNDLQNNVSASGDGSGGDTIPYSALSYLARLFSVISSTSFVPEKKSRPSQFTPSAIVQIFIEPGFLVMPLKVIPTSYFLISCNQ